MYVNKASVEKVCIIVACAGELDSTSPTPRPWTSAVKLTTSPYSSSVSSLSTGRS